MSTTCPRRLAPAPPWLPGVVLPPSSPVPPPCARRPAPADPLHTRGFPPRWHLRAERPSTAPQASPPACSQSADPLHRPMRQTTVTGCNLKDRKPQSRGPLVPPYRVPRSSWSSSAELRPRSHLAARAVVLAALPRRVPYNWVQFSAHVRVPEPVTPQPRKLHPVSRRPADRSPVLTPPPSLEGSRRAASPGPSASPDHPLQPCADSSETSPSKAVSAVALRDISCKNDIPPAGTHQSLLVMLNLCPYLVAGT